MLKPKVKTRVLVRIRSAWRSPTRTAVRVNALAQTFGGSIFHFKSGDIGDEGEGPFVGLLEDDAAVLVLAAEVEDDGDDQVGDVDRQHQEASRQEVL